MSFPFKRLALLFKIFVVRVYKGESANFKKILTELIQAADSHRKGESLTSLADKTKDHFFKEGLELIEGGLLDIDEALKIMNERNDNIVYLYMEEATKVKNLGKYPPAFGMMGTTIGMIVLLANLGGADAIKTIGPAMGVCLITTLYGTVVANFAFLPFADNMIEGTKEINLKNQIIVEALRLISTKTNPIVVAERLNSYLKPSDRLDWKSVLGG